MVMEYYSNIVIMYTRFAPTIIFFGLYYADRSIRRYRALPYTENRRLRKSRIHTGSSERCARTCTCNFLSPARRRHFINDTRMEIIIREIDPALVTFASSSRIRGFVRRATDVRRLGRLAITFDASSYRRASVRHFCAASLRYSRIADRIFTARNGSRKARCRFTRSTRTSGNSSQA